MRQHLILSYGMAGIDGWMDVMDRIGWMWMNVDECRWMWMGNGTMSYVHFIFIVPGGCKNENRKERNNKKMEAADYSWPSPFFIHLRTLRLHNIRRQAKSFSLIVYLNFWRKEKKNMLAKVNYNHYNLEWNN